MASFARLRLAPLKVEMPNLEEHVTNVPRQCKRGDDEPQHEIGAMLDDSEERRIDGPASNPKHHRRAGQAMALGNCQKKSDVAAVGVKVSHTPTMVEKATACVQNMKDVQAKTKWTSLQGISSQVNQSPSTSISPSTTTPVFSMVNTKAATTPILAKELIASPRAV
eukprot:CAMPEP_0198529612 /NCGR_PEP_ID=MMETSP1462-20131121/25854_1 /TAXON_ID=1333877 /ORGANISM="Brandtodinium nutriculum, Strain RCC3387" /LENGTH=165 /DNA_ID=CAMNT_0044259463 /DNA_START=50 /DNA_END=548 /DNA_ORIENTATION=-